MTSTHTWNFDGPVYRNYVESYDHYLKALLYVVGGGFPVLPTRLPVLVPTALLRVGDGLPVPGTYGSHG
jgi:hypothetical protein